MSLTTNTIKTCLIKTLTVILVGMSAGLAGCSTGMQSSFDCQKIDGEGLGCTSPAEVNDLANQGYFSQARTAKSSKKDKRGVQSATALSNHAYSAGMGYPVQTPHMGDPMRYGEVIQRVWIAPWQDQMGMYYDASYITFVMTKSHWIGMVEKGSSQRFRADDDREGGA